MNLSRNHQRHAKGNKNIWNCMNHTNSISTHFAKCWSCSKISSEFTLVNGIWWESTRIWAVSIVQRIRRRHPIEFIAINDLTNLDAVKPSRYIFSMCRNSFQNYLQKLRRSKYISDMPVRTYIRCHFWLKVTNTVLSRNICIINTNAHYDDVAHLLRRAAMN